jgi:hypothetical protein
MVASHDILVQVVIEFQRQYRSVGLVRQHEVSFARSWPTGFAQRVGVLVKQDFKYNTQVISVHDPGRIGRQDPLYDNLWIGGHAREFNNPHIVTLLTATDRWSRKVEVAR